MRSCMLGLIESFYCFFQSLVFGPFDKRLEMVHFINVVDCSTFVVVDERQRCLRASIFFFISF